MKSFAPLCLCAALLAAVGSAHAADWQTLFDGRSLAGWKASEHPDSVKVADGLIVCDGPRSHLFYVGEDGKAEFENFELELEVKAMPGANSGVYFHATWQDEGWPRLSGIEVQVNNNQPAFEKNYVENKKTGSLYGFRNLYKAMARDGEWFTMNIQVRKPRVEVRLNGRLMIDYVEPTNVPVLVAGATRDQLTKGTFALQCHDEKSQVSYRNIRVRRLPPGEDATVAKSTYDAQDLRRQVLARDNFPLLDLRTHLEHGPTLEQLRTIRSHTGLFAGLALKIGNQHAAADAAAALAAAEKLQDEPIFTGLEVTPRLWLTAVSPEARARFDYIVAAPHRPDFTSGDEQKFMDALVGDMVDAMAQEPIDVYANPLGLPSKLAAKADALWTEERMQKVITAAALHGVALEINPRLRTPSEKFIKLAKAAGVKFTIGSDDTTLANYTDWPYLLEVQQKAGLVWRDMWVPGHGPTRAQRALRK